MAYKYKNGGRHLLPHCPANPHTCSTPIRCSCVRHLERRMWTRGDKRTIQNADYDVIPVWFMGNWSATTAVAMRC